MRRYPHYIIAVARELRLHTTKAESLLWERLRNRRFEGLKFRRQHHIGRYIADFYCAELDLVVELEGTIHDTDHQRKYDKARFQYLEVAGLRICRIRNEQVTMDIDAVLQTILSYKYPPKNDGRPECGA